MRGAGGKDDNATIVLDALQQIVDLDVGITAVTVFDRGTLAKERIGFIEEEDSPFSLRRIEELREVLLCFTNVFAAYLA
jgi:hypothetical protein